MEKLKDFPNYAVTEFGEVYSYNRNKFLKPGNNNGYLYVALCKNGKVKNMLVHRLVAMAFISNPENKKEVNHIDGDKSNNCVSNLEWCTSHDNIAHAWKTGLCKNNYINSQKTIKSAQLACIKHYKDDEKYFDGLFTDIFIFKLPIREISKRYNISASQIYRIKNHENLKICYNEWCDCDRDHHSGLKYPCEQ